MAFSNPPIDLSGVPTLAADAFTRVDPAYRRMRFVIRGVVAAVVALAGLGLAVLVGWLALLGAGVVLFVTALSVVAVAIEVRLIAWQAREHDLSFRHGVIRRTVQTLPLARVQHARITRGPLERRFGLATLHVNTAGPDLHLPGLSAAEAERLHAFVIERAGDLADSTP